MAGMTRSRLFLLAAVLSLAGITVIGRNAPAARSSQRPPGTDYKGQAFTFHKITEGVYHAVGTGNLVVMSNAAVIEGDSDVLVVDSHVSPGGAWALREELKAVTTKPIRYVVNSHFHFDHSHGNQIYGPEVEIIGHEFVRAQMVAGKSKDSRAHEFYVGGIPNTIKTLEARLAAAKDDQERETVQRQLAIQRTLLEGTNAVTPTPPNVTLTNTMTLFRGGREIRIAPSPARPATSWCPQERIVATGDLLVEARRMGDASHEWIDTIEALKTLDFDTVSGHGQAFKGASSITGRRTSATSGHRRRSSTRPVHRGKTPPSRWICAGTP